MLRTFLAATAIALISASLRAQMTQVCFPGSGGVINCPCGQPNNPAGGCDNFGGNPSTGGVLSATGNARLTAGLDTLRLNASGLNSNVKCYFYTGSGAINSGVPHGAGVRCVTGGLKILYPGPAPGSGSSWWAWILWLIYGDKGMSSSTGVISRPRPFTVDKSVSARSTELGVPITAGQTRYYFVMYQDPLAATPCGNTAAVVNLTNAGAVTWSL